MIFSLIYVQEEGQSQVSIELKTLLSQVRCYQAVLVAVDMYVTTAKV